MSRDVVENFMGLELTALPSLFRGHVTDWKWCKNITKYF